MGGAGGSHYEGGGDQDVAVKGLGLAARAGPGCKKKFGVLCFLLDALPGVLLTGFIVLILVRSTHFEPKPGQQVSEAPQREKDGGKSVVQS